MLTVKVEPLKNGLHEVQLLKNGIHFFSVDDTLNKEQAENVRHHIDYMFDRLNYLEPMQAKFEKQLKVK